MAKENILTTLKNDQFNPSIQKRPNMFIGTVGIAGLENMIVQTLDGLLGLFSETNQGILTIDVSQRQFTFSITAHQPFLMEQEKEGANSPFLYLAVLQALSEQVGISLENPDERKIFIYQKGSLKKQVSIPLEEGQHKIELAFIPDQQLFGPKQLSYFVLFNRCQQLAMLNAGLTIELSKGEEQKNKLFYKTGLIEYIFQKDNSMTRESQPLVLKTTSDEVQIEAVISKNGSAHVRDTFVNGHLPVDGGTHYEGFVDGMVAAINQYLAETNRLNYLTSEKFVERFDFVVAIKIPRPRYTGIIKKKIRNPELYKIMKEATFKEVSIYLRRHPSWYLNDRLLER